MGDIPNLAVDSDKIREAKLLSQATWKDYTPVVIIALVGIAVTSMLFLLMLNLDDNQPKGKPSIEAVTVLLGGLVLTGILIDYLFLFVRQHKRVRNLARQLHDTYIQTALILNTAGDGIIEMDKDGNVIFINTAATEMVGWEPDEIIGCQEHETLHSHKADGGLYPKNESPIFAAIRENVTQYVETEVFTRKDGSLFPVQYICKPVHSDAGEVIGAVLTFQDISVRKKAEAELRMHRDHLQEMVNEQTIGLLEVLSEARKATEDARAANRAKDEFLANMSHELRTPVHAILSLANISRKEKTIGNKEKLSENLQLIDESGNRLLLLLNDLLDLSKLEAKGERFRFKQYDLREIVDAALAQLSPLIKDKRQMLDVMVPPDVSTSAECDEIKITQVLWNLLSNAIKFSPHGSTITVAFEKTTIVIGDNGREKVPAVALSVIDSGVGIPKKELESVFNKFIQSSKTKTGAGGTGLGLAISREIIQAHHGRIWAENNVDRGVTFVFVIPIQQPVEAVQAA